MAKLTKFMAGYVNRFSPENVIEFKNHDAKQFNAEINFEIDDRNRLLKAFYIHFHTSGVSTALQLTTMLILSEGAKGWYNENHIFFLELE